MKIIKKHFLEIKELWKRLYEENIYLSPYSSYEFAESYRKNFHMGFKRAFMKQEFYVANDGTKDIAIIPLIVKGKNCYLYGDLCASGYLDLIYSSSITTEQLNDIFSTLKTLLKSKILILNKINERSLLYSYLQPREVELSTQTCVNIKFGDDYDEYFKSLGKSIRQNVRTAYNRMNREEKHWRFEIYINQPVPADVIEQEMQIYDKREEHRNNKKTSALVKIIRRRFNPISVSTASMENAVHACFYIDDKMAAFLSGYVTNDKKAIVVPRHAINDDFNLYCAGALLITETIKYCITKTSIRNLDLSRGDEKYKYTLGGKEHYNHSFKMKM